MSRCTAGQAWRPVDCDWHNPHHWCDACQGWYGVPHDYEHNESHVRDNAASGCACRPCTEWREWDPACPPSDGRPIDPGCCKACEMGVMRGFALGGSSE